jgi:hypothetical protein
MHLATICQSDLALREEIQDWKRTGHRFGQDAVQPPGGLFRQR